MANTITKIQATAHRLVLKIDGDGTVATVLANATILAYWAAADRGPLYDLFNATYANQADMRTALFDGTVRWGTVFRTQVAQVTAEKNLTAFDVDTDAVTATKPEINFESPDTTGSVAYVYIEYVHSIVR